MKVVLGLPTANKPSRPFLQSLSQLELPAYVTSLERVIATGNFVPGQRELIARKAAAMNADVLIMMDDDMVLPPHTLTCLLGALGEEGKLGAVGVVYYSRDGKQPMAVTNWHSSNVAASTVPAFTDLGPVQVDGVGFGCVAIRMTALAELDLPLFSTQVVIDPESSTARICNEDYLLCERLRMAGWRVALDGRVRAGHYDRDSDTIFPERWENNEETQTERVLVRNESGHIELIPFDGRLACITEEYQTASIQYVIR